MNQISALSEHKVHLKAILWVVRHNLQEQQSLALSLREWMHLMVVVPSFMQLSLRLHFASMTNTSHMDNLRCMCLFVNHILGLSVRPVNPI